MTFDIEAHDEQHGKAILADLRHRITAASRRLEIGFVPGIIVGQLQPTTEVQPMPTPQDPEELFA